MDCVRIANIVTFYSKCGEFRAIDKYTDVSIQCDGETFRCHRLILASASPYFDTMFSGDFRESKEDAVILGEVDLKTFKEVLEFIYTGEVKVDSDNFYSLLRASDYFQVSGLEDLCVQFAQKNKITDERIFDIFAYASKINKKILQSFLIQDIKTQLKIFSKINTFLEMPFSDLCVLVDHLMPMNEDVLYGAVIRWIEYNREQRGQYLAKIFEKYHFENMSTQYLRFISSNLYNSAAVPLGLDENIELMSRPTSVTRDGTLYIYVKDVEENSIAKIFSVNGSRGCSIFDRIKLSGTNEHQLIRSVALDESYIYSLEFGPGHPQVGNQSFTLSTIFNMNFAHILKSPPLIFGDVSMCTLGNSLYLHNRCLGQPPTETSLSTSAGFNHEEIRSGIYLYNCEVDKWFPVPPRRGLIDDASLVSCDHRLFSVGGRDYISNNTLGDFQTYDSRTGIWQELPDCSCFHISADCCVLGGEIYVCGGSPFGRGEAIGERAIERYNFNAGKWERLADMSKIYVRHKVLSFSNEIWVVGNFVGNNPNNQTPIEIYNPNENKWRTSSILIDAIKRNASIGTNCKILDAIVQ